MIKSVAITETGKTRWLVAAIGVLFLALSAFGGCATLDIASRGTQEKNSAAIAALESAVGTKADRVAVAAELTKLGDSVKKETTAREAAVAGLREETGKALSATTRVVDARLAAERDNRTKALAGLAEQLRGTHAGLARVQTDTAKEFAANAAALADTQSAIEKLAPRVTAAEGNLKKVAATANGLVRSREVMFLETLQARYAPGAEKVFVFTGFRPGQADFGKILETKTGRTSGEELTKMLADGKSVLAAVGMEDPQPCPNTNPLCSRLGLARSESVLTHFKANGVSPAAYHRRVGEMTTWANARAVVVYVGTAPVATTAFKIVWEFPDEAGAKQAVDSLAYTGKPGAAIADIGGGKWTTTYKLVAADQAEADHVSHDLDAIVGAISTVEPA